MSNTQCVPGGDQSRIWQLGMGQTKWEEVLRYTLVDCSTGKKCWRYALGRLPQAQALDDLLGGAEWEFSCPAPQVLLWDYTAAERESVALLRRWFPNAELRQRNAQDKSYIAAVQKRIAADFEHWLPDIFSIKELNAEAEFTRMGEKVT